MSKPNKKTRDYIYKGNYSLAFLNLSLVQLIENYPSIEKEIEASLIQSFLSYLENSNCTVKGNNIEFESNLYHLFFEFSQIDRCFHILLKNLNRVENLSSFDINIKEFGQIQTIKVSMPRSLAKNADLLTSILSDQIKLAYSSLEEAYISKVDDITKNVFKNLHAIVLAKAKSLNYDEEINGHFWFDITILKQEVCKNFVTQEMLRAIIEHVKKAEVLLFSPFVLISHFLTIEVPEYLTSEALKNGLETISIPISSKYKLKHEKVWSLENIVLMGDDCQTHLISKVKDDWLQVAYPKSFHKYFKEILDDQTKLELKEQFTSNYKYFSKLKKRISNLKDAVLSDSNQSSVVKYSKDMANDILLKDRIKDIILNVIETMIT